MKLYSPITGKEIECRFTDTTTDPNGRWRVNGMVRVNGKWVAVGGFLEGTHDRAVVSCICAMRYGAWILEGKHGSEYAYLVRHASPQILSHPGAVLNLLSAT